MTPTTIQACLDLADRTLGEIMRSAVDPNAELTERAALVALARHIRRLEHAMGAPAASIRQHIEDNERLRLCLAACSVAAGANTRATWEGTKLARGNPAWSVALDDVRAAVLREIEQRENKDQAYEERNCVVALVARMALMLGYEAGIRRTAIEGWSPEWHGCVFIELPLGQASWHYHDSQAGLFRGLPPYTKEWDGHTTGQKYEMIRRQLAEWEVES